MTSYKASDREMTIERVFDAPRELVYRAWTEPEHLDKWYGPDGMSVVTTEHDFSVGGSWRFEMGPAGSGGGMPMKSIFREIVPLERVVTEDSMETEGQSTPVEVMTVTATFEDQGDKTKLTLHILHASEELRKRSEEVGIQHGWSSAFDCLDRHLVEVAEMAS